MLYLAELINENLDLRHSTIRDSIDFLDNNLLSWIESFIQRLDSYHGIYIRQIAIYLKDFLQNDRDFLNDILKT